LSGSAGTGSQRPGTLNACRSCPAAEARGNWGLFAAQRGATFPLPTAEGYVAAMPNSARRALGSIERQHWLTDLAVGADFLAVAELRGKIVEHDLRLVLDTLQERRPS